MSSANNTRLLSQVAEWARSLEWVDWLEVGGSFGRGHEDELSDIDAGIGVVEDGTPIAERVSAAISAAGEFAAVADTIVQDLDGRAHLIVVYVDGRQLSLVIVPATYREGLPPQSKALVDRSGRLATGLPAGNWTPSAGTLRDWAFEAWIGIGDAARHAERGHTWRALRSLTEARDLTWQLWAAQNGVPFPAFGAVSVSNVGLAGPEAMTASHPATLGRDDLIGAARSLAGILRPIAAECDVAGVAAVIEARLDRLSTGKVPE